MAWNFSSLSMPYTTIGAPGVSDTAAPRRPERSTATSWPSSARTTSSWPATECTAPRTSDQRDVLAGLAGAVTDGGDGSDGVRSEEHTSELQSHSDLVCRLLLE